jgi:hypothetical protein
MTTELTNALYKELEEMSENNAPFTDYFHKIFEIIDGVEGNQRAILLYKLLSIVRDIGYENGKTAQKEAILKLLNQ